MRSQTFVLYLQTGDDGVAPVTVTVTELENGTLEFSLSNDNDGDNSIGDIRAIYFNVADDSLLGGLAVTGGDITDFDQSGSVVDLGNGSTVKGVPNGPFEIGVEFGTAGMSADDIQSTTFVLTGDRALTLDDISLESIAVRQTSVTSLDGGRNDSDKLYGEVPFAVNAIDDNVLVYEDTVISGNLFENDIDLDNGDANNDGIADGLTITEVTGGFEQNPEEGIYLTVSNDGTYLLDAEDADWLGAHETFTGSFSYTVVDGNGGSDTATATYTIVGENDGPTAVADQNTTLENALVAGNVLANDTDPDRNDVLSVDSVNGIPSAVGATITLASSATLTLNADGSYQYDPNGAFDHLNTGEQATDQFSYSISDGNGGSSSTTVVLTIEGVGVSNPEPETQDHFGTFANKKGTANHEISNVVLYLQSESGSILKVKIDNFHGETDLDNVDLDAFLLDQGFIDYDLLAVSIKAGNNHNRDLGPGEGQLFLLDGNPDIDYVQGGDVPDGLTLDDLSAHANITFNYDDVLIG